MTKQSLMPLASDTMKGENNVTFLSLSGLTRQSIPPQADLLRQALRLLDSGSRAGMTATGWPVIFAAISSLELSIGDCHARFHPPSAYSIDVRNDNISRFTD
jgi:hypothetical protein